MNVLYLHVAHPAFAVQEKTVPLGAFVLGGSSVE
jgi:hypothetical protein